MRWADLFDAFIRKFQIRINDRLYKSSERHRIRLIEPIIPLLVLVGIPSLIVLSQIPYHPVIPSLYSWIEINNIIRYPYNLTSERPTEQDYGLKVLEKVFENALKEQASKSTLYFYYLYNLILYEVGISRNGDMPTYTCPPHGYCYFRGFTMTTTHYLGSVQASLLFISLIYAFYALRYRADDYFKKKGSKHVISEYELVMHSSSSSG